VEAGRIDRVMRVSRTAPFDPAIVSAPPALQLTKMSVGTSNSTAGILAQLESVMRTHVHKRARSWQDKVSQQLTGGPLKSAGIYTPTANVAQLDIDPAGRLVVALYFWPTEEAASPAEAASDKQEASAIAAGDAQKEQDETLLQPDEAEDATCWSSVPGNVMATLFEQTNVPYATFKAGQALTMGSPEFTLFEASCSACYTKCKLNEAPHHYQGAATDSCAQAEKYCRPMCQCSTDFDNECVCFGGPTVQYAKDRLEIKEDCGVHGNEHLNLAATECITDGCPAAKGMFMNGTRQQCQCAVGYKCDSPKCWECVPI
jgi:hypothetical protein